ncbi:metal-dependent hydrolase family protein [Pediococcus ethanolidurans]|uniref:Amidohydrolase n=1 Tax=Pediococcus ethanolidurans TaxID=319653 RepID=A0A0R2K125_9LACO|nr:amidohydrolase family protein [Pediococcus ethanolidurans]KRN83321.1 amidohydrolase [Pediococcus ethanolidurans]GEN94540.1 amidohydrolase [Pediococcus ethanolidurans]SER28867.1 Imidazolonepropionase [Pediococcus ethanolidurans]
MRTTYFNAKLFNGIDDEIVSDAWFTVDDETGKITETGTETPLNDNPHVDLHGQYVMPGLINAHTHLMMNPDTNKLEFLSETEIAFTALRNLKDLLHSGVTYIRDCGCAFNVDLKLHKLAEQGEFTGTEIFPSGRPFSMIGGHGDFREGEDGKINWSYLVSSNDEMRKSVRQAFKHGAKNIKVMATGGVMSATDQVDDTELSEAEMQVAVEEAHSKHMIVAAHAQGNQGIQNALDAGVDSIEHGIYVDEQQATFMREHNVYLVPTLNAAASISKYGEGKIPAYMIDKNKKVQANFYKNIAMALKKGVKIVVGTDAGTPFNSFKTGTWEEMALLVHEIGATPYQALLGATSYAAQLLRIDDAYGSLAAGKVADFLVLKENPLEKIEAVQQADKEVYKKGHKVV